MERQILSAMLNERSAYETFERVGSRDGFSPIGSAVLRAVSEYYQLDPDVRSVSRDLLEERITSRLANPKHEGPHREYLRSLPQDVSAANVEAQLRELYKRGVGSKLSLALANGAEEAEVTKLIQAYQLGTSGNGRAEESAQRLVDVLDTSDLTEEGKSNVEYIRLWPKQLNDRLDGGALRGHHVLVFARPETGKTLFAINLCAGFLKQQLNVLYVGNEEPVADVRDRLRGRLLGESKQSIRRSPRESAERLKSLQLGSLRITEGTSFAGVRTLLASRDDAAQRGPRYDVVILDQVRNMRLKSDSRTAELEAAGIEARAIAKEFNVLVVSITQAGDSATNKVYLEMSDVDSSKTGIPASADLMIGVGADDPMKANGLLGISLPKNKLSGIHDRFTVTVNFSTGVIE